MLIGADDYWDIVGDDIIRGNGPTAVASRLGYFLSGPLPESALDRTNDQRKGKRRKKRKKKLGRIHVHVVITSYLYHCYCCNVS